jgi:hypothetical protein
MPEDYGKAVIYLRGGFPWRVSLLKACLSRMTEGYIPGREALV